ncbi:MAG: hypothetical protein HY583_02680 [Candidatus Omnitrophica bacterium]|nr:hypothetical protein [Candidatus Omnitrophota bacterium]
MKKQKRKENIRKKAAFTLIELTIGISLFTLALFGIIALLGDSLAFGKLSGSRLIVMNETRRVLEEIRRVADTGGLSQVASDNWTNWASQNLNNTLTSQNVAVTDTSGNALINNADPLPVRVTMTWTEKGKINTYSVDTMVTKR